VLGLRWGEVAGLRVGRLDLLRNELTVAEQIVRGKGGVSFPGPPKSRAGRRTMAMPAWLSEMLAAHLHQRGLTAVDHDAWAFASPSGAHLSYSAWASTGSGPSRRPGCRTGSASTAFAGPMPPDS
jgi:hypothetical protein